jgi:hypothetical protein
VFSIHTSKIRFLPIQKNAVGYTNTTIFNILDKKYPPQYIRSADRYGPHISEKKAGLSDVSKWQRGKSYFVD